MAAMHYRFCPLCGSALAQRELEGLPRLVCSACEFVFYANSKPTAGALVVQDDRLLLVRRAIAPFRGLWDIPGGFLEAGEHPEAGAIREVREETGLAIALTRLLGVYMDVYQQIPTLNLYYQGHPIGGEARAGSDASELAWFSLEALPPMDQIAFENGRAALADWLAGRQTGLTKA